MRICTTGWNLRSSDLWNIFILSQVQRTWINFTFCFVMHAVKNNFKYGLSQSSLSYYHLLLHNASKNYDIHWWTFKIKAYWNLEQYPHKFLLWVKNLFSELKLICNVAVYSFNHVSHHKAISNCIGKNRQLINLHYLNATLFLSNLKWNALTEKRCDNASVLYVFTQYKRECRDYSIGFLFSNFNQRTQISKALGCLWSAQFQKKKTSFPK